ncbi:PAS domain-containing sensor histidine kinase [Sulfitobacter sabulilitoris]|nr:PAS domain-containing sensor histidine kinase [Sulfitobacter sabulilitoris]
MTELLNHVAAPVFVLDVTADGTPVYSVFNDYAMKTAAMTAETILGRTAKEIYGGRFGEMAYQRHLEVIASGKTSTYELELPLRGIPCWVRTTLKPVTDAQGRVVQLIGTSIDITAEQQAREMQASFRTITGEMEQFVSLAAHDLRAPMRNVKFLAEMLREDFLDQGDGKVELIDLLEDVATKSAVLISDVLSHAQSDTSSAAEVVPFDFGALCQSISNVLDPRNHHRITWFSALMQGEKTAFQIVLRNLVENAIKHARHNNLQLEIALVHHTADMIEIEVRDDGKGFDNPALAFLGSGQLRSESGYGLFGVRRLIAARGGTISVKNGVNRSGSIVRFSLPGTLVRVIPAPVTAQPLPVSLR